MYSGLLCLRAEAAQRVWFQSGMEVRCCLLSWEESVTELQAGGRAGRGLSDLCPAENRSRAENLLKKKIKAGGARCFGACS
ncbi:hypothetical protein XENORESO_012859 [Xenotaenia resolanae]|uniref:Uncharacterized protein n=1 Tax=Xenotaenia resolanae TaxID=208358 RepID=A0ABV0VQJ2_9TELE